MIKYLLSLFFTCSVFSLGDKEILSEIINYFPIDQIYFDKRIKPTITYEMTLIFEKKKENSQNINYNTFSIEVEEKNRKAFILSIMNWYKGRNILNVQLHNKIEIKESENKNITLEVIGCTKDSPAGVKVESTFSGTKKGPDFSISKGEKYVTLTLGYYPQLCAF